MKRRFLLGSDFWTDCDDAVAIRLLTRAAKRGDIELCGIVLNAAMEDSVAALDGFLATEGISDLPISIAQDATDFGGRPPFQKRLSQYAVRYRKNSDVMDALSFYRKTLGEAKEPIEMLEIGFLQVIVDLLESGPDAYSDLNGIELVKQKVKRMWVMAGKWDEVGGREHNFCCTPRTCVASEAFCRLCPVPVTFLGWEVGHNVLSGGRLREDDVLHHVLADHGSPNGRSSWDPMLVLLALTEDIEAAGYRPVQGVATVDSKDGSNYFKEMPNGPHQYVVKTKENSFYEDAINARIE